jgi:anti-sigma-K factor RskA
MNESLHIADTDLTLYAMGALPAGEMETARAHVQVCARCTEELRQIELALAAYAQTTPEADVPAGAKQRFMARVAQSGKPAAAAAKTTAKKPSLLARWFGSPRFSLALAAAMALLLIAVSYDDMRHRAALGTLFDEVRRGRVDSAKLNQIMELLTSQQVQRVALHEAPSVAPPPEARVVYAGHNGKLLLTAQNLHPLPAGKVYQLWILQPNGGKPLPAGTFAPDSSGNAAMILADEPENVAVLGFAVTIEDAGGSETPTPPLVLSGH